MSYTYAQRKRPQGQNEPAAEHTAPGPGLNALMAGTARPSAAQKGRPIEMDAAIKAKMEHAFGDLSAVKLYESPTVGAAGAEAMAQGSEIAFAPGMADFSTTEGQARLGHELSHVVSQARGDVTGDGFLNDAALDARADREGAMAAAGQQIAMPGAALSSVTAAPAVGPMQAKKKKPQELRPYEMSKKALKANSFNPGQVEELDQIQDAIQNAETGAEAYRIFAEFAGNDKGYVLNTEGTKKWNMEEKQTVTPESGKKDYNINIQLFKNKLKHMARQVYDYPELKGHIGNIHRYDEEWEDNAFMSTDAGYNIKNGVPMANLYYNAYHDRKGSEKQRDKDQKLYKDTEYFNADLDHTGNHELGHVQNFLLMDKESFEDDKQGSLTANSIVDKALKKVLSRFSYKSLKRYKRNSKDGKNRKGQIKMKNNDFWLKGITSRYGTTDASEFFAEAFSDVYQNGKNAKKTSIAVVKEYEKARDAKKKLSAGNPK